MELFAFHLHRDSRLGRVVLLACSYLLNPYYVSGTTLSTGDTAVMETDTNPSFPGIGAPVTWGWGWVRVGGCGMVECGHCQASSLGNPWEISEGEGNGEPSPWALRASVIPAPRRQRLLSWLRRVRHLVQLPLSPGHGEAGRNHQVRAVGLDNTCEHAPCRIPCGPRVHRTPDLEESQRSPPSPFHSCENWGREETLLP